MIAGTPPAGGTRAARLRGFTGRLYEGDPGRALVMGVVNVTPDSFSDGGLYLAADAAIAHGLGLAAAGADLLDVGGESTRPGAGRVTAREELDRVLPVVEALAAEGLPVSIDTMRAEVARAAVAAGASLINDVSGGLADPAMAAAVAETGIAYVCSHWRGQSAVMDTRARYDDVVAAVTAELSARLEALTAAGVAAEQIVLDPGLGFAKLGLDNVRLLANLDALHRLGRPLLIGASRKRFLGEILGGRKAAGRDDATAAVTALAAAGGAWGVRVHTVRPSADAVRVAAAYRLTEHSGGRS